MNTPRPIALLGLLLVVHLLPACTKLTVSEPLTAKYGGAEEEAQMEFWHALYESKLTSNDEAFHGLLLFMDPANEITDYETRVAELKSRGLLDPAFDRPANEAVTRGDLAVIVSNMLKIKGGALSSFFPHSGRYAMRELQYANLFPPGSPWQSFTGGQFVSIVGRLEDYTRSNPTDLPAKQLPDGEAPAAPAKKNKDKDKDDGALAAAASAKATPKAFASDR